MKLKLVATISALAIPALAHAQQSGPQPKKPTKADAQNVVQIIISDKVKTQAYCDLAKLEDQVEAAAKKMIPRRSNRSADKPRRWSTSSPNTTN